MTNHRKPPTWRRARAVIGRGSLAALLVALAAGLMLAYGAAETEDTVEPEPAEQETVDVDLPEDWFEQGETLYLQNCSACHQSAGDGIPGAFPALAGNPFVTGHPQGIVHLLLNGRAGMPAFGGLPDEELALIASYVRNAWENEAHPVDADMIATVRDGDELDLESGDPMERPGAGQ